MNIRKALLSAALAVGLIGSIAAPAALAQSSSDSATVWVGITNGGTFWVQICDPIASAAAEAIVAQENIGMTESTPPTASLDGLAKGTFYICYWDDGNHRGAFDTELGASDFEHETNSSAPDISNQNFRIAHTGNLWQANTDANSAPHDIGDIGYYVNESDPNGQSVNGADWGFNNTLNSARRVHFGHAGVGTTGSFGEIKVELQIPAGSIAGNYSSDITVTVIPD